MRGYATGQVISPGQRSWGRRLVGGLVASVLLAGCTRAPAPAAPAGPPVGTATASDIPEVLATIGTEKITMADIRTRVGHDLDKMEMRYRRARHRTVEMALQDIVRERTLMAEAERQKKTVDELVVAEAGGTLEPSEVEIATWYKENPNRTGGRPLDQIRPQIADFLRSERQKKASEQLTQRLNRERQVTVLLQPFRLTFNDEKAPSKGPRSAPFTLVEFSDFQCPFCSRFFPTLKQLEQQYGDTLRIVYRQYPLTKLHPYAFKAAEASLCASEQGKFWEMHDLLFQDQARISVNDLKVKASRLGLNQKKFDTCLDSGQFASQVQEDLDEGAQIGVDGTPALFLNGISIDGGAVPLETVVKAIEQERARQKP